MATAEGPTKRTRHLDTKTFAIQQWVRGNLMNMGQVPTNSNIADHFTKALGRVKSYEQTGHIMGRQRIPT